MNFGTVGACDVPTGYVCSAVYLSGSSLLYSIGTKSKVAQDKVQ